LASAGDRHDGPFAFIIVIPRARPELQLLPMTIISRLRGDLDLRGLQFTRNARSRNWSVLAGLGLTNFTVGCSCSCRARRSGRRGGADRNTGDRLCAALGLADVSERPAAATLAGGAIVFAVVVWHTYRDLRETNGALAE